MNGDAGGPEPGLDESSWADIPVPALWERHGYDGLDGIAWYRTAITLTEAQAAGPARLSLGPIDDNEITWINGIEVGRTNGYSVPRLYDVPASVLKPGRNVLTVRVWTAVAVVGSTATRRPSISKRVATASGSAAPGSSASGEST